MTVAELSFDRETCADLLRVMDVPPDAAAWRIPVATRRVRAGAPLFVEGALAEAIHVVRHGGFKTTRTSADGYEQVLDFAARGELLGGEALDRPLQRAGAVALEDSSAWVLPLRELNSLRQAVPAFGLALQRALARQLLHAGEMADLMSAVAAEVRVARFLILQSARASARGESASRLRLRMARRDIGSYLGLAHETISRSLTLLARWGCVRVNNREVEILDADRLGACARSTRGRWVPDALQALAA